MRARAFLTLAEGSVKMSPKRALNRWAMSPGQFDMLNLVLANGDGLGLVEQDIRCHQHGIGEQASTNRDILP